MLYQYIHIAGIAIMIAAFIISRIISEKGLKLLSNEEKGLLVSDFTQIRKNNTIILSVIVVIYMIVMFSGAVNFLEKNHIDPTFVYFAMLFLYMVLTTYVSYKKVKSLGLPDGYVSRIKTANTIKLVGFVCLFVSIYLRITNL
jgi:hypothetical protein